MWFPIGFNSALDKIGMDVKKNNRPSFYFLPIMVYTYMYNPNSRLQLKVFLTNRLAEVLLLLKIIYNLDYFSCRNIQQ